MPKALPNPASQGRNVAIPAPCPVSSSSISALSPSQVTREDMSKVRVPTAHPSRLVRFPQTEQLQGNRTTPDPTSHSPSQDQTLPPQTAVVEDGSDVPRTRQDPSRDPDLPDLPGHPIAFTRHPTPDVPSELHSNHNPYAKGNVTRLPKDVQQMLEMKTHQLLSEARAAQHFRKCGCIACYCEWMKQKDRRKTQEATQLPWRTHTPPQHRCCCTIRYRGWVLPSLRGGICRMCGQPVEDGPLPNPRAGKQVI